MPPCQLDQGIYLEDIDVLIPWGITKADLVHYGDPEVRTFDWMFTWSDHVCFGGIPCTINAVFHKGYIGLAENRVSLHHVSVNPKLEVVYSHTGFDEIRKYLLRVLPAPSIDKAQNELSLKPIIIWDFPSVRVRVDVADIWNEDLCFFTISHHDPRIEIMLGDINALKVDAVFKTANPSRSGDYSENGKVHLADDSILLEEINTLDGYGIGRSNITRGYRLPSKWVIYTDVPLWVDGKHGEEESLAAYYRHSLSLAVELGIKRIAFPTINTDEDHFPRYRAVNIAVREVKDFLEYDTSLEQVIFVCFDKQNEQIYRDDLFWV